MGVFFCVRKEANMLANFWIKMHRFEITEYLGSRRFLTRYILIIL